MPGHPKRLPADSRRSATVATVVELAAEQNPGDITTAAIAARMGLTQGALFRHFPTKDAILEAVMAWVAERLLARIDAATRETASPGAALAAIFLTHVDFVSRHAGIPRMIFGELQRPGKTLPKKVVQRMLAEYGERLQRVLEAGKAHGEFDAALDARAAAALFIGSIQGLVVQSLLAGDTTRMRRDAPGVFAIYLRGIRRSS
ncbi:MAG: TetR/AcrR family transcriptional regulator [Proteobacteria bacterium]|nr:TetR/AcrR family transcriptional regulator [Pseudomonadota bacterium]